MRIVKTYKDIEQVKHVSVLINIDTGEEADELQKTLYTAEARLEHLQELKQRLEGDGKATAESKAILENEFEQAQEDVTRAEAELDGDYVEYLVRQMSPLEALQMRDAITIEKPQPPVKKRELLPLDTQSRIVPEAVSDESYVDNEDPVYLKAMERYNQELKLLPQRSCMYTLACCVKGFDLSDEEIKEALSVKKAFAKEPLDQYRKRLDQMAQIVLAILDTRHLGIIQEKIGTLSGATPERVNFMLGGSRLLS